MQNAHHVLCEHVSMIRTTQVYEAIMRHVDWSIVKCLVIAGPGFTKDEFRTFLDAEAVRRDDRALLLNKSSVVLAPASSAFKHCLKEVLALPAVAAQIKVCDGKRDSITPQCITTTAGHQGGPGNGSTAGVSQHDGHRPSARVLRARARQGSP